MSSPASPPASGSQSLPAEKSLDDDYASTIRQPALHFDGEDEDEDLPEEDHDEGDYSVRMEELLDDEEEEKKATEDEDEDEGFIYSGVDADVSTNYRDQLRDVLGPDHEDEETLEEREVEKSLLHEPGHEGSDAVSDEPLPHADSMPEPAPSRLSVESSLPMTPPRTASPSVNGTPSKRHNPYLHPTVSRLRSFTPQSSHLPSSAGSAGTTPSRLRDFVPGTSSHFSSLSRTSSLSNLHSTEHAELPNGQSRLEREVFRWTQLKQLGSVVYTHTPTKASAVLGSSGVGAPMVLAANGLICVGTDMGRIYVFDFKQILKCVCGTEANGKVVGPVSALALSHDHTFVAAGHSTGHIQLFDLSNPQSPARAVAPTTMSAVVSGRQEGHLPGSRIVNIGFVAGRHTAVVSADEHGLAFYHSLGKVLFVDASDTLRILGKYPEEEASTAQKAIPQQPAFRRRNPRHRVLSMLPLPLGTASHPTDTYNVVALLTPAKLVIVGLKPTPKTWFKRPRLLDDDQRLKSRGRVKGTITWWPSILQGHREKPAGTKINGTHVNGAGHDTPSTPILAYCWGSTINLLRVTEAKIKQNMTSSRTGKVSEVEIGTIACEDAGRWNVQQDVLAMQWLNANQLVVITATTLDVYSAVTFKRIEHVQFDSLSLVSPTLRSTVNGAVAYADSVGDVAHSLRVYKGKIFLLGREAVQVGTLLTWADRILSFVQEGDFLSAIELTRTYYVGEAPGNRNGLPDDPQMRRIVVGEKLRELMVASARYAFSEDRMTDGTHVTPDGRGVDRTSLFEGLVTTCAKACVSLDDYDFLFEDLFQYYEDAGITRIFLVQLEPFILDSAIKSVPPRITQRLLAMHEQDGRCDLVERVIWHIDPTCLDINQAIHLCQKHSLWDALIYVYTRALRDYVSPLVELVGLIRKANQFRKARLEESEAASENDAADDDAVLEPLILSAYKIYPYLANVLSGLTYPSEEPLEEDAAFQAKKDVYAFVFCGRSTVWPVTDLGTLVLTSEDEGGVEPTYPYARLLLQFDAESFLHSLDIAFEDSFLNDESQGVSRLLIVKVLLEILASATDISSSDATLVHIFVARNVPKYPQFLQFAPTTLHNILVSLAEDEDARTREDRQLAAEYLLSVYNPHDSQRIMDLFEMAGFYRILRSWHRHERQWSRLIMTYLRDPDIRTPELFANLDDVLDNSLRGNKGSLPPDVRETLIEILPALVQANVATTALLVEKHSPDLHRQAVDAISPNANLERLAYLRCLLGPPRQDDEEELIVLKAPLSSVPEHLVRLYLTLQCRYQPVDMISVLKALPTVSLDWTEIMSICEDNDAFDAVVWACNARGEPRESLQRAEEFEKRLTLKIVNLLSRPSSLSPEEVAQFEREVAALESLGRIGISICLQCSQGASVTEVPLEDIWFQLLSSQIHCVLNISGSCVSGTADGAKVDRALASVGAKALVSLRRLVQDTFGALVSISSTRAVSFPRLFKRLVDTASQVPSSAGTPYTEFRAILTGMLESYRSDGDILVITKRLVERDLFETVEACTRERSRGWATAHGSCLYCRKSLLEDKRFRTASDSDEMEGTSGVQIIVSRTGVAYHSTCQATS